MYMYMYVEMKEFLQNAWGQGSAPQAPWIRACDYMYIYDLYVPPFLDPAPEP